MPGRRALCFASTNRLDAPPVKLSTIGSRAFPLAASQIWNSLSENVVLASTLQSFQHQLKKFLFELFSPQLHFVSGVAVTFCSLGHFNFL